MARVMLCLLLTVGLMAVASGRRDPTLSSAAPKRTLKVAEMGATINTHVTVPCNASVVGSEAACFDQGIHAVGNDDFPVNAPEVAIPADGTPWGMHLTGPYPDGVSYLVSWFSMSAQVADPATLSQPDMSIVPTVRLSTSSSSEYTEVSGETIDYKRLYTDESGLKNFSYRSPLIHHVVLNNLKPNTMYYYSVGANGMRSQELNFTTLASMSSAGKYPLRVGLIADVGQTANSSITMQQLMHNQPDVIMLAGDNSYADNHAASDPDGFGSGTNQLRWDSYFKLWEPLYASAPLLNAAGNHEIESGGIGYDGMGVNAAVNWTITEWSFPKNYPFQSYSARLPVPGTRGDFGNINNNVYYSTIIGGIIKLITMSNYVAFQPGSPQYEWAMAEFESFDRSVTPWLFVMFHVPPYHTYATHYKESECFMSIWEPIFYKYGTDVVLNGHVHAYERTHPIYNYTVDQCGPMYFTLGDGGNVEGPYRNFVDEVNPKTNKTYCEGLAYSGNGPNAIYSNGNNNWGPSYQLQAVPPGCPTTSWQPASSVNGQAGLVPFDSDPNYYFCQSSQPDWSAHRDPSFGHAILDVMSATTARFRWYRNIDGGNTTADEVVLERLTSCPNQQSAPAASKYALIGDNLDMKGYDLGEKVCQYGYHKCEELCDERTSCQGFTWVYAGPASGHTDIGGCCYLKTQIFRDQLTKFTNGNKGDTYVRV